MSFVRRVGSGVHIATVSLLSIVVPTAPAAAQPSASVPTLGGEPCTYAACALTPKWRQMGVLWWERQLERGSPPTVVGRFNDPRVVRDAVAAVPESFALAERAVAADDASTAFAIISGFALAASTGLRGTRAIADGDLPANYRNWLWASGLSLALGLTLEWASTGWRLRAVRRYNEALPGAPLP
jgi:hypothetical protein